METLSLYEIFESVGRNYFQLWTVVEIHIKAPNVPRKTYDRVDGFGVSDV